MFSRINSIAADIAARPSVPVVLAIQQASRVSAWPSFFSKLNSFVRKQSSHANSHRLFMQDDGRLSFTHRSFN
jgi:hypothetical protein